MASSTKAFHQGLILALAIVTATAARLVIASTLELAPDEAYYWLWSRELHLSYPDHPPLVAYMIRLGTWLCGDTELGVRLCFALSTAPSMILTYGLGRTAQLEPRWAVAGAVLGTLLPTVSAASLIATPDTAAGLSWLAGTYALARLTRPGAAATMSDTLGLGAAMALGLWSKHSCWLLVLLAAIALRQSSGRVIARAGVALGFGALAAAPSLLADLSNHSSAAVLQLNHLLGRMPGDAAGSAMAIPQRMAELLSGQLGLLTPLLAWLAFRGLRDNRGHGIGRLLAASYLIPLGATMIAALLTHPEQNWASLGHPALVVAACVAAKDGFARPAIRRIWWANVGTLVVVAVLIHTHALSPFLPLPPERDPVSRLHGWSPLRTEIELLPNATGVECDNYGLGAELIWQWRHKRPRIPVSWSDRPSPPLPPGPTLRLDEVEDPGHSRLQSTLVRPDRRLLMLRRRDGATVRSIEMWMEP